MKYCPVCNGKMKKCPDTRGYLFEYCPKCGYRHKNVVKRCPCCGNQLRVWHDVTGNARLVCGFCGYKEETLYEGEIK
jgi:DNA-directed RNA polymerase subunit M/transcription elongation factor TFIIS